MNTMRSLIGKMTVFMMLSFLQIPPTFAQHQKGASAGGPDQAMFQNVSEMAIDQLASLIDERLSYMKDVAAYKWQNLIPIEDTAREKVVLQKSLESAKLYQIDPEICQAFFEQQINLAKKVQQFWFDEWTRNGFDYPGYGDLETFLRPALIDLSDAILKSLCRLLFQDFSKNDWEKNRSDFFRIIDTSGIDQRDKRELFEATLAIVNLDSAAQKTTVAR